MIGELFGGTPRSPKWKKVRDSYIEHHNVCECCSSKNKLQVHHIEPFCVAPDKELEYSNLITLCSRCHLFMGHCGNWRNYNGNLNYWIGMVRHMLQSRKACSFGSDQPQSWACKLARKILSRWYHFD